MKLQINKKYLFTLDTCSSLSVCVSAFLFALDIKWIQRLEVRYICHPCVVVDAWMCVSLSVNSLSHPPLQLEDLKTPRHLWLHKEQTSCCRSRPWWCQLNEKVMKRRGQKTQTPAPPHSSNWAASAPDLPKAKYNVKIKSGKLITWMSRIQMALCLP